MRKERSESKERARARGYQYSHCRRYTQVFFLAVWIWQRIFCIVREPIYPLSNMVLRANHTEMIHTRTHFKDTNTLTEDLRTHGHKRTTCAYTQALSYTHTHTHIYISNRYFETNPNMLLAWNLINSRWVCVCETVDVCDYLCLCPR